MNELSLSPNGLDFIKAREFFVPHAYQDSAGIWTIGYGATWLRGVRRVREGDKVTQQEGENILAYDVQETVDGIRDNITNKLNQNQQDAVISLAFNIGVAGFNKSTVLKLINLDTKNPDIKYWWMKWNKITVGNTHKELPGLTKRREQEFELFKS